MNEKIFNRMQTVLYNAISMLADETLQYEDAAEWVDRLQDNLGVTLDELKEMGIMIDQNGRISLIDDEIIEYQGHVVIPTRVIDRQPNAMLMTDALVGETFIKDRLELLGELSNVTVQYRGFCLEGFLFDLSFKSALDKEAVDELLAFDFVGLSYEIKETKQFESVQDLIGGAQQQSDKTERDVINKEFEVEKD